MSKVESAKLTRHAPYLPVANVERSLVYYEQVLGFRPEYSAGTPPVFAICRRDGLAIMLRKVDNPRLILPNEKQGGTWDVFFWVIRLQVLHVELKSKGAILYGPLVQESYRMNEFAVRDCDGHVIGFGKSLDG